MKSFRTILLLTIAATLFAFSAPLSMAQSANTGALTGTVTDPSGAVISGATVTITNLATGQSRSVKTDANGSYKFSLLPPANYDVEFAAAGFKTFEVPSVTVNVTETPVLNRSLEVGAETQQVTVESNTETIQTQNATNGALVGSKEVTSLPLSSRNYTQIIDLSPGVVVNVASAAAIGSGTQDINVNGSGSDQNNYMMDGATITNYGSGGGAQSGNFPGIGIPNPDAIAEFKVQTSQYDASYGQNPGASVNVVTKGGTNSFHGDVWEFNRNSFFNANDFFLKHSEALNGQGNTPPTLKQNQFGFTLGGPIKKNKIFFFGSYQGTRQLNGIGTNGFSTGFTNVSLLPFNEPGFSGAAARADQGAGYTVPLNLVPGNPACDASTYQKYLGCAFAGESDSLAGFGLGTGQAIAQDGSNINQVAINLLRARDSAYGGNSIYNQGFYVPSVLYGSNGLPNCRMVDQTSGLLPGGASNCTTPTSIVVPLIANENQFVANSDFVLSSKNTLSERVFYSSDPQVQSFTCLGGCYPGAPENATYTTTDSLLRLTSILTSNLVNEARVSYQREVTNSQDAISITACSVGIVPMVNNGVAGSCPGPSTSANHELQLVPVISSSGLDAGPGGTGAQWGGFNLGGNFFAADTNYFNTFQFADQISWNHGRHAIRAGFNAQRVQYNWTLPSAGRGEVIFGNISDIFTSGSGIPGTTPTPVENGVLANLTTILAPNAPNYHALRINEFAAFTEDDIKVTPKLTVNLGLRWEYDGLPSDDTGLFTNFWGSTAALVNTGSFFLGNEVANGPGTPSNQVGTLAGFVVPSNYNANATICGGPCGYSTAAGAVGVYTNTGRTLTHGSPIANFAPRLGFAWQPFGSRFVVRAGYGVFYDRIYGNLLANNQQALPPYAGAVGTVPSETFDNPDQAGALGWKARTMQVMQGSAATGATIISDTYCTPACGAGLTNNATSDSEFMGTPLIQQYNLDVQYEFAKNWIADIGYVGTHGAHLYDWARDVNAAYLVPGAPNEPTDPANASMIIGAGCVNGVPSPVTHTPCSLPFNDPGNTNPATEVTENTYDIVAPNAPTSGNEMGRVALLGLAPSGGSVTSTVGDSLYNNLQAQLRHQFTNGLLLQASYTWSKSITNINASEGGGGISAPGNVLSGGATSNNPNDLAQQYGLAAFNRPQRLVVSYSYDLPYRHMSGFKGHVLGGWTVSGVTTIQDGEPFTITGNGGTIYGESARAELQDPVKCNSYGTCQSGIRMTTTGNDKCRLGIAGVPGCGGVTQGWINDAAFGTFTGPGNSFVATPEPCIGGTVAGSCGAFGTGSGLGFGDSGVGIIMGPGQFNSDMSVQKNTKVTEGTSLQFRAEFYNLFNHPQFNTVGNSNTSAALGTITQSSVPGRVIQFGLKFFF
ncbi:MAG: carboxypeptidase regulatory-like domain-containing protein [Candidatus Acidiferrales bacterium]